jgi:hypothetical protein
MCGRRVATGQRQRQEDEETADDIFELATAAVEPAVPEDTVPGTAWESRVGGQPGTHTNTGKCHEKSRATDGNNFDIGNVTANFADKCLSQLISVSTDRMLSQLQG